MRPYTSNSPWKCSTTNCKGNARFKSDDGRRFYCDTCAKRVLIANPMEAAAAFRLAI
jgi:hypothetical protein